jgi:hypothetical protein
MGERMVSNFVALVDDATQQVRMGLSVLTNNEESRWYVLLFKYFQDIRRPSRIWSIIEGESEQSGFVSGALNNI